MAAESPAGPEPRMSMRVEWVATMEVGFRGRSRAPRNRDCPRVRASRLRALPGLGRGRARHPYRRSAMPHDNPLGLDGFEFVEFTGPNPDALAGLFTAMGFTHLGNHKSKNVRHYG